jgi:hypothetical protein
LECAAGASAALTAAAAPGPFVAAWSQPRASLRRRPWWPLRPRQLRSVTAEPIATVEAERRAIVVPRCVPVGVPLARRCVVLQPCVRSCKSSRCRVPGWARQESLRYWLGPGFTWRRVLCDACSKSPAPMRRTTRLPGLGVPSRLAAPSSHGTRTMSGRSTTPSCHSVRACGCLGSRSAFRSDGPSVSGSRWSWTTSPGA